MSDPIHLHTLRSSYSSTSNASASSSQLNGSSSGTPKPVPATSLEQRSANHQRSHSGPVGTADDSKVIGKEEINNDTVGRRHRPRRSGGFLLDSAPAVAFESGAKRHTIHGIDIMKGKNKEKEIDMGVRSYRDRHTSHRHKPSIGSSPLATKVTNVASPENHGLNGVSSRLSNTVNDFRSSADRSTGDNANSDRGGFDADPAQIVNLALNLSESRRRQASIGRLSPMDPLGTNRRIVSAGPLGLGLPLTPVIGATGGSLRYQVQQQWRGTSNLPPKSDLFDRTEVKPSGSRLNDEVELNKDPPLVPWYDLQLLDDPSFNPSDATLLRTDKAKVFLELSYEYRRLLQYLPRLPLSPTSRPTTARGGVKPAPEMSQSLGRAYNPLQYVRNRKVRGRERKEIDAEADGWKEVDKVRGWVNTVASRHEDLSVRVDDNYTLPQFEPAAQAQQRADDPSMLSPHRSNVPSITNMTKPPRPRSVWENAPWDLLADAYWLELDEHKKLIEDRDGHKLLSIDGPQVEQNLRPSRDVPRIPPRRSASIPRTGQSPERLKLKGDLLDTSSKERGRRNHQPRDSITSLREYNSSQDRKGRWHRKLIRSQSSSSSNESAQDSLDRNPRLRGRGDSRERQDSAVLERQVLEMLAKETENVSWGSLEAVTNFDPAAKLSLEDILLSQNGSGKVVHAGSNKGISKEAKRKSGNLSPRKHKSRNEIEDKPRVSFDDLDLTAPNSPTDKEVVPSIAINLSPPGSRSGSPRKPMPFQHRPPKRDRTKEREVDRSDFATVSHDAPAVIGSQNPPNRSSNGQNFAEYDAEVVSSPNDSLLSPRTAEAAGSGLRHRRSDSRSLKGFRDEPESKIRGLLKGSRLADMVGKPVSRVGDLLFRKDGSHRPSSIQSPTSSYASEASETDEDPSDSRDIGQKRSSTDHTNLRLLPSKSLNGHPSKYHMDNLPSFRSSEWKNSVETINMSALSEDDHITRQQQELRDRGRPSRFDRFAPPNLDMRSVSPSPSPLLSRIQICDADMLDESRRPSATASDVAARRSLQPGHLGLPEKLPQDGPPPTGIASLGNIRRTSSTRAKLQRHWSVSNCDILAVRGAVSQHDITRVRAFLLSSGVKANEIYRRANEIPVAPSKTLQEAQSVTGFAISPVPRCQEHQLAARVLIEYMDDKNSQLNQAIGQFSHGPIGTYHEKLRHLDSRILSTFTPRVRASADDADALNMELATSYRLDVKRLNDSIDYILRRKRRRFRWVRGGAYLLLEWMLLGAMWWVWLIVVIVRLAMGFVGGLWRVGRWLFCL